MSVVIPLHGGGCLIILIQLLVLLFGDLSEAAIDYFHF